MAILFFFFQAEDGIRDLVRSRGLGDVYKRQNLFTSRVFDDKLSEIFFSNPVFCSSISSQLLSPACLLYTSDAADERSSVDLGGRRIIKKKTRADIECIPIFNNKHYNQALTE